MITVNRSYATESEYQQHMRVTQEMFGSFEDYIEAAYIDPLEAYILRPNRFPYKATEHSCTRHYLMWLDPKTAQYFTASKVRSILEARFPDAVFHFWINEAFKRSVKSVPHYHIYVEPVTP